jgi:hypothetical protein
MTNVMDHENFLMMLRQAAMNEANTDLRYGLKTAADGLQIAIHALAANVTPANLIEVNGLWAYAVRMLELHKGPQQPQEPTPAAEQGKFQSGVEIGQAQRKAA